MSSQNNGNYNMSHTSAGMQDRGFNSPNIPLSQMNDSMGKGRNNEPSIPLGGSSQ